MSEGLYKQEVTLETGVISRQTTKLALRFHSISLVEEAIRLLHYDAVVRRQEGKFCPLITKMTVHDDGSAEFLFRGGNRITVNK